jgi:hypothetical protein
MPEDFYFAYGYDGKSATRLYRFISGNFERFDPGTKSWEADPGQSRIFVGEDLDYEEITEEQANKITVLV